MIQVKSYSIGREYPTQCVTLNLFKNLRLRIAIVRSAWRQPAIL